MTASMLVFAAVILRLAYVRVSALAALALVIGGFAWILVLSTLNSQYSRRSPAGPRRAHVVLLGDLSGRGSAR